MLHGRVVRPRGQGAYGDGTNPQVISVDANSISHIPGVEGHPEGELHRGRRAEGVQRDPGSGPAEGDVGTAAVDPGCREPLGPDAEPGRDGTDGSRPVQQPGQRRQCAARRCEDRRRQTYSMHYNGHVPIGPTCVVADVTSGGARIFCNSQDCYNTPRRDPGRPRPRRVEPAGEQDPCLVRGGVERVRHLAVRRRQPVGGGALVPRRRPGAAPVHALGRARVGSLRAGAADGRPGRSRRERQHRRNRLHPLLDPVLRGRGRTAGARSEAGRRSGSTSSTRRTWGRSTRSRTSG